MNKKKHCFLALFFMFALLFMLSSCELKDFFNGLSESNNNQISDTDDKPKTDDKNNEDIKTKKFTVNFYNLDTEVTWSETVEEGKTVRKPSIVFLGYDILNWYTEFEEKEFDFEKTITKDINLYPNVKRILNEFSLTDDELILNPKTTKRLQPKIEPSREGSQIIDYSKVIISSSDESVVTVKYDKKTNIAVLTGVKNGNATIKFEFENNVKTYDVLVETKHYLSSFEISEISEITYGTWFQIEAIKTLIDPTDTKEPEVEWLSTDVKILTVDRGLVIPVGIGTATVIAECDGFKVEREIKVVPSLEFNQETFTIEMNKCLDKPCKVFAPENYKEQVVLESSDESIATIENGVIKALMPGNVKITAKLGGVTKECNLIVTLNSFDWTIKENKEYKLAVGDVGSCEVKTKPESYTGEVKWESTNEDVAFVIGNKIVPNQPGTTTIKATCGNLTKSHKVTVYKNIKDLSVDNVPNKLGVYSAVQLKITKTPANDQQKVEYSTSNINVLSVTKDGRLTGKSAGKADLIVTCANITKTYTINVLNELFVDAINKDEYIEYDLRGKSREERLKLTNDKIYSDLLHMYEANADNVEKCAINTAYDTLNIITLKFIKGNASITKEAKFYIKTEDDLAASIVKQNDEQKIYYVNGKLTIDIFVYGCTKRKIGNKLMVHLYNYKNEEVAFKSIPIDIDGNEKKRYTITFDSHTSKNIIPGKSINNYNIKYVDITQ